MASKYDSIIEILIFLAKKIVASSMEDGSVNIWDVEKQRLIRNIKLHTSVCYRVDWNPIDPTLIASTSKDRSW